MVRRESLRRWGASVPAMNQRRLVKQIWMQKCASLGLFWGNCNLGGAHFFAVRQDGDSRIKLGREEVFALDPFETLVLGDDGDLNRASDRLWTRYRKPDESDRRFH